MTTDEFVKIVRSGSEKLRVDEIVINTGGQELHGKGILRISHKKIDADIAVNKGERVPEVRTGIYTKKDNWKLSGLIEDSLRFKCEYTHLPRNMQCSWPEGITRCTFDLHPIDLVPSGWDAMTRADRKEFLKQNQTNPSKGEASVTGVAEDEARDNVSFYATLLEYKRVHDVVQSAEVFNAKHMLETIVTYFGLQWENDMELVFKTWQQARHPSVHHSEYATRSEDDLKEVSLAESRIAGAINILLLKLFGYSGYMRHSAFEDGYRQI